MDIGQAGSGGDLQRLPLSPRCGQQFQEEAPRLPDVLLNCLDEITPTLRWADRAKTLRPKHQ